MHLFRLIFLFFLLVPLIEIYLLLRIGGIIGILPTVFMVVATAVIGAWLLRVQGFSTWQRFQVSMANGEVPTLEIIEGPILLVGGALLLTPGFFTDILGFLCLIPISRKKFALYLMEQGLGSYANVSKPQRTPQNHDAIEGEYKRDD